MSRGTAAGARIRIGNQTSYRVAPEVPFDYAIARGFDAFEWFPDRRPSGQGWGPGDLDAERREEFRRRAIAAGLAISVHAPLPSGPAEGEVAVALAADLGATLLNVHFAHDDAQAIARLALICADRGMRLAIENNPGDGPEAFNDLFARLPEGAAGMCLDIGHANLHSPTRNDYLGYVDRIAPHVPIIHVHAHENRGDRDSHFPLFSGPAGEDPSGVEGLVDRLRRRNFCGSVILEQWPDPPDRLIRAREGLMRLFAARGCGGAG